MVIDAWTWPAPDGRKPHIAPDGMELPCKVFPVNIAAGEWFGPGFLAISPNGRIPAFAFRRAVQRDGAVLFGMQRRRLMSDKGHENLSGATRFARR